MRLSLKAALSMTLLAAAVSAVGCGGSGRAPKRTPATRAAFVTDADAICTRIKTTIIKGEEAIKGYKDPERARISILYAKAEGRGADELSQLHPPGGNEREWLRVVGLRRGLVSWHHKLTKLASDGEHAELEKTYTAYKVAQKKMIEGFEKSGYGFKVCASEG
jgi:hypothetical protein